MGNRGWYENIRTSSNFSPRKTRLRKSPRVPLNRTKNPERIIPTITRDRTPRTPQFYLAGGFFSVFPLLPYTLVHCLRPHFSLKIFVYRYVPRSVAFSKDTLHDTHFTSTRIKDTVARTKKGWHVRGGGKSPNLKRLRDGRCPRVAATIRITQNDHYLSSVVTWPSRDRGRARVPLEPLFFIFLFTRFRST